MKCPKCSKDAAMSAGQGAAMGIVVGEGLLFGTGGVAAGILTMPLLPFLLPFGVAAATWLALKKTTCASCGAKFNAFQAGTE